MDRERSNINQSYMNYIQNPSKESLAELMAASTSLIHYFAQYYYSRYYETDVIQVGYEGVLKAIKNYKNEYGTSFSTYAGHCILGEIRHYIRKEMRFYKPPFLADLQEKANIFTEVFYLHEGDMPTKSHLAKELNIKEEGVDEVLRAGLVSLDELDLNKISCLHYESFKLPIEDQIVLYEGIRKLSEIKQTVIYSLFFHNRSQQQTADSLGINQRKVSRLLKSSLVDLKEILTE